MKDKRQIRRQIQTIKHCEKKRNEWYREKIGYTVLLQVLLIEFIWKSEAKREVDSVFDLSIADKIYTADNGLVKSEASKKLEAPL